MNVSYRVIVIFLYSSCNFLFSSMVHAETTTQPSQPCMKLTAYVSATRVTNGAPPDCVLELTNSCTRTIVTTDRVYVRQLFAQEENGGMTLELPDSGKAPVSVRLVALVIFPNNAEILGTSGSQEIKEKEIICEAGKTILFKVDFPRGYFGTSPVRLLFTIRPTRNSTDEYARSQPLELNGKN